MSLDVTLQQPGMVEMYTRNVTHNLNKMAEEAGIYKHLWKPETIGISKASELIEPLTAALALLESEAERFEVFNPANGWGSYDGFVDFVREYLNACIEYPNSEISICR